MDGKKVECEVGDVHHVLYYGSTHVHQVIRTRVVERGEGRDGRVFPYVAHYLATGDMLYPVHEGGAMVTRLLQELTRLDLVQGLFRTPFSGGTTSSSSTLPPPKKEGGSGGSRLASDTLKVNTRRHPLSLSALLTHLRPAHSHARTPAVYRPPSNKRQGNTLVVVSRSALRLREVVVHGPRAELGRIFPGDTLKPAPAPAQPALDAQVSPTPPSDSTLSPAHAALGTLADKGYTPTVRSSWVCGQTGALITQWLVYRRRGGLRRKGGGGAEGGKKDTLKPSSSYSFPSHSKLSGTLSSGSTSSLFSSSFLTLRRVSSTTDLASVSTTSTTSTSSFSSSSSNSSSSSSSSSSAGRSKLKTRSKSILTLHNPPPRPSITLKRLLSVFF